MSTLAITYIQANTHAHKIEINHLKSFKVKQITKSITSKYPNIKVKN